MVKYTRTVPDEVTRNAAQTWTQWRDRIAAAQPGAARSGGAVPAQDGADLFGDASPRDRMIAKIRRRMAEHPEWYETDPARIVALVCAEMDRIGAILVRDLPATDDAVEVWPVPMSVFNWLVEDETGERFVRGALSAWSRAEGFNAANGAAESQQAKTHLRAAFLDIAPPLLRAVLEQMVQNDELWVSFAQKYVGPDLKFLVMRVQRPRR